MPMKIQFVRDTGSGPGSRRWMRLPLALLVLGLAGTVPIGLQASELARLCMDCHGRDGVSVESDVPSINGMSSQYLVASMAAYWEKSRPCPSSRFRTGDTGRLPTDMCRIASMLSTQEVEDIAAYFSSRPFMRINQQTDLVAASRGRKLHMQYCEQCHSNGGAYAERDAATLAGQRLEYLRVTFQDFGEGTRAMPAGMETVLDKLDEQDIEALVQFYGSHR